MSLLTITWDTLRYFPYRLKLRIYYPIKTYFINVWKFRSELSQTRGWGYTGLLLLMRRQLIDMEINQRVYGNHLNHLKVAKDIRVTIKLLDRLIEDDYDVQTNGEYDWVEIGGGWSRRVIKTPRKPKYIFPKGTSKQLYKHEESRRRADIDMLFNCMKQYRHWWN